MTYYWISEEEEEEEGPPVLNETAPETGFWSWCSGMRMLLGFILCVQS